MEVETIKQIGQRLKGLREVLDIPAQEVADLCEVPLEHYLKMESGEADPSVYRLAKIAKRYGIDLDVLLFGEEPRMSAYFVTRKNQGLSVDRRKDYKYQSLAAGFRGRKSILSWSPSTLYPVRRTIRRTRTKARSSTTYWKASSR